MRLNDYFGQDKHFNVYQSITGTVTFNGFEEMQQNANKDIRLDFHVTQKKLFEGLIFVLTKNAKCFLGIYTSIAQWN